MANLIYFFCHIKIFSDVQQVEFLYTKMCTNKGALFSYINSIYLPNICIIQKYTLLFQKFAQTEIRF